jgi:hypothetical protein
VSNSVWGHPLQTGHGRGHYWGHPNHKEIRMPPNQLTERAIAGLKPTARPAKYGDGMGLFLNRNGSRWWRFRFRFNRKQNTLSLGTHPNVSLEHARTQRDQYRALLADGLDPANHHKAERAEQVRQREEQRDSARFLVDSAGALSIRWGKRTVLISPAETADLRAFLEATKTVASKATPCL